MPVPALFLPGIGPRIGAGGNTTVYVLALVGGIVGLVYEAVNGFTGSAERRGATVPMWLVWGVAVAVGAGGLVSRARRAPWYRGWSMLEMLDRPDGITVFSGRLGARHEGLAVGRGETLTVDITRELRHTHRFVVTAPSGTMTFSADLMPHRATAQPLEEAAARHGITLVTTGAAERIRRTVTA